MWFVLVVFRILPSLSDLQSLYGSFLQEERVRYMTEASDYKQRVEELERELSGGENSLKSRRALRERKDDDSDVDRLKDELKHCNDKLRKYVQHSERLEKERSGVMSAISSCNVEDIVGDNMEEMVVSLCEKLTSVEEECDALANSEEKATEYLAELDSLRVKYDELEQELEENEESNRELSRANADCKLCLKKAQDKITALMKDKESLQSLAESAKGSVSELQSEKRRQMQYLENENLQLGDELKKTKMELQMTKAELDAVQKNAFCNEATEELCGLSNILESSSKHDPKDSAIKRLPLSSADKRGPLDSFVKKHHPSESITEEGYCSNAEKENFLNHKPKPSGSNVQSPFTSSKKRKSVNPFSSVKKAARKRMPFSDDSPKHLALGEETEHTGEMTSECKQS